jgi:hypothetical protein
MEFRGARLHNRDEDTSYDCRKPFIIWLCQVDEANSHNNVFTF